MAFPLQKSALNVVVGAMTFGEPGKFGARVHEIEDVEAIIEVFKSHGHSEIDTARAYTGGSSEEYLGRLNLPSQGFKLETKLYPTVSLPIPDAEKITHTPECIKTHLQKSLKALNVGCIDLWYLHAPDRSVPYEVTLKAVNDLHIEGHFKRFGISNYPAWEVAEIVQICRANGYIQPTVYQGLYNALHRAVEPELFPCLRKYGISFYAYNPLAAGLLVGKLTSIDDVPEPDSQFEPGQWVGKIVRARYWKEPYFKAINSLRTVAEKYGLTTTEVALRWLSHHSSMKREYGDSVLIGASSVKHTDQNLTDLEKGPLPDEVVQVLDAAWREVQPYAKYFHQSAATILGT